ncbi:MAG TPA: ABC transporter permease [Bryobacteraceae bacterium]|jgi:predicted permease|nr:ABC transporter permease [Bryobacteraceae bacterium]
MARWWNRLFNRNRMEEQLDREVRFHLDQHSADLIAQGRHPLEAQRQAQLALGGSEQVKEECRDARGTRWLEDLWQDFRYALRTLRQKPGFSVAALLTLGLGSGATTVMFTVINGVLLKPLAYPEADRLVSVHEQPEQYSGAEWSFAYFNFLDCQRASRSLTMAAWRYGSGTVSDPGDAEFVSGRQISAGLFSVLGIPLVRGRAFLPDEDRPGGTPVAIISYGLWQSRFGGGSATGARLIFEGLPYTVVGVAPRGFRLSGDAEIFTPLGQNTQPPMRNREMHPGIQVIGRERTAVTLAQAQAELTTIARQLATQYPKANAGRSMGAKALRQEVVGDVRPTLWLLLGAVSLVLLIACVNVASLLLARAVSRERELAMRVALGAGRGRLARQCLTEGAVLALSGGGLGVALAALGVRPFLVFWPGGLPRADEVHLDWRVLLFALAAALVSGLLFGLAPALRAPALALEQALRAGSGTVAGDARRLHKSFVVAEIALAAVLLIAAGILERTLLRLSALHPGIDSHNVLVTRVALSPDALASPARTRVAWQEILERVNHAPGVRAAALSDLIPMGGEDEEIGYWTTSAAPPANEMPMTLMSLVTPGYLRAMGIPLRDGRFFTDQDRVGSAPVIVIDERMAARAFGGHGAVGKRLSLQFIGPALVVGVVGHVRHWGLDADDRNYVREQIYLPFAWLPDEYLRQTATAMSLVVRSSVPPLNMVEAVRRQVRGATRDQAMYEIRTMDQVVSATLARQRFLLLLFGIFAALALLLACIGIYGVLAYLTGQRVPEIGVRMALGATARDVLWMVLRQSLGMIVAGAGLGLCAAFAASRLLEHHVNGVQPAEASTFALVLAVLMAAALFASYLPARRASRVNPVTALRQE